MLADAGPVKEGLEASRTDNIAIEIVVMAERPGPTTEFPIAHIFAPESDTAKSIAADSGDASLAGEGMREIIITPCPCNGIGATPLYAECGNARGSVREMPEKPRVRVDGRKNVIFQEEHPLGYAEGCEMRVDLCAGHGHFLMCGSPREVGKTLEANGERDIRVFSVVGSEQPPLHGVPKRNVL